MTPPIFDGSLRTDPVTWIFKFELYAQLKGLSEEARRACFILCMNDVAAVLKTYNEIMGRIWRQCSRHVSGNTAADNSDRMQAIWTAKQSKSERVRNYYDRIISMAADLDMSEQLLTSAIQAGLNPSMKQFVARKQPKSLKELLDSTTLAESTDYNTSDTALPDSIASTLQRLEKNLTTRIWLPSRTIRTITHGIKNVIGHRTVTHHIHRLIELVHHLHVCHLLALDIHIDHRTFLATFHRLRAGPIIEGRTKTFHHLQHRKPVTEMWASDDRADCGEVPDQVERSRPMKAPMSEQAQLWKSPSQGHQASVARCESRFRHCWCEEAAESNKLQDARQRAEETLWCPTEESVTVVQSRQNQCSDQGVLYIVLSQSRRLVYRLCSNTLNY